MGHIAGRLAGLILTVAVLVGGRPCPTLASGEADPLSLARVGVLVPFFASAGSASALVVSSPVGPNVDLHLRFYQADCRRSVSRAFPLATNQTVVLDLATVLSPGFDGFAMLGRSPDFQTLTNAANPIHAHVIWTSAQRRFSRVLDPIAVGTSEPKGATATWSALRTGATFYAPLQSAAAESTLYLLCPRLPRQDLFLDQLGTPVPPAISFANRVQGRVYNLAGTLLRQFSMPCACLQATRLVDIDPIYGNASHAAGGTFTELGGVSRLGFGTTAPLGGAFVGYLGTRRATDDTFGRLHTGSWAGLTGSFPGGR